MKIPVLIKKFCAQTGLLDKRCFHCQQPYLPRQSNDKLCPECAAQLSSYNGLKCALCGLPPGSIPLTQTGQGLICTRCLASKPAWTSIAFYGLYDGILKDLLLRFKFGGELRLAQLFGDLLYKISGNLPMPDFITAIPQHSRRLRQRGFNQAHEIARVLAKLASCQIDSDSLSRPKECAPQEKLNAAERRANMAGAFKANAKVCGKNIWLVDDIMTTGATCNEAAATLLSAGAASVHLLVAARTPV